MFGSRDAPRSSRFPRDTSRVRAMMVSFLVIGGNLPLLVSFTSELEGMPECQSRSESIALSGSRALCPCASPQRSQRVAT